MLTGIDRARARLDYFEEKGETKIDIHPEQTAKAGKSTDFFGPDGPSFRDVIDAINPLNHIPIVSDIVQEQTGHQVSAVSRMVGGALLGGPIGFVASLASVIFEDATGSSPAQAAYAALTGTTEPPTALARNDASPDTTGSEEKLAQVEAAPVVTDEITATQLAALSPSTAPVSTGTIPAHATMADRAVLDLYGSSPASVHSSYRKAQMRPYLQDVTTSKVL